MLSEDGSAASVSTMRVAVLLVVLLVLAPRIVTAIKTGQMPTLSAEEMGLVLGALGIKAYQRGKESTPADAPAATQPQPK